MPGDSSIPGNGIADIPLTEVTTATDTKPYGPLKNTMSEKSGNSMRRRHFGHRVKPVADSSDGAVKTRNADGELVTVNTMGRIYRRVHDFSIITRYFLYVLPLGSIIAVPIIVGATGAQNASIGGVRMLWFFVWVEILWLSLWVSKVVVHFLPTIFQVLAGVVSSGTRKYALILRALSTPLSFVGWSVTSLATFKPIMTRNPTNRSLPNNGISNMSWINIVQAILGAWVVATLVLLIEKLLIQLISINYHRKQFNAKIRESKHNAYLIGLLYDASRKLFPMYCAEFAEEDYTIADQLDLTSALGSKNRTKGNSSRRSGSATPARLLLDVGKFGDKVTSAFGNVAQEITGKEVFKPNSAHAIVNQALDRNKSSEALARRLWMSFVIEGRDALYADDVLDVLGPDFTEAAEEAFAMLDRDGNGDVSLDEMIMTVTEFGRERKAIANSLHDVDQAINVLDRLLLTVCFIAIIFVFVAFLNANFVTTLATAGTALLSLSFVFAVTAQEFLGSCIFLFVKHPYDIGDMICVGSTQEHLIVDHISLLFSVFRRASGTNTGRLVQVPHIVLNALWIENVSRSKAMKEQFSLMISFDTSFEDIQLFKTELLNFVQDKENSRDFSTEFEVEVLGTQDMSKLELRVEIRHKSNWANETVRAARRSKFMCAMIEALRKVPIYAPGGGFDPLGSKANANYSVTISDSEAREANEQAAKEKDATRMVPLEKTNDDVLDRTDSRSGDNNGGSQTQNAATRQAAINDLTSRPPAYDAARDETWNSSRGDSSTLDDEQPTINRHDADEVRGIMRKASMKGRRRADSNGDLRHSMSLHSTRSPADTRFPVVAARDNTQPGYATSSPVGQSQQAGAASQPYSPSPAILPVPRPPINTAQPGHSSQGAPPQVAYNPMSPLVEGQTPLSSTGLLSQQSPAGSSPAQRTGPYSAAAAVGAGSNMSTLPPVPQSQPGYNQSQGQGQQRRPQQGQQRRQEDV